MTGHFGRLVTLVPRHDRSGLARNHREQQKESQLRDIERIRNKKAELRRKAEVRRCQGAGERGQYANSAAVSETGCNIRDSFPSAGRARARRLGSIS